MIFEKVLVFVKWCVDSFVGWGLYTDTTRAGRRWRLPNAPYGLVAGLLCFLVDRSVLVTRL
uniref:hypothetical protein n=1 Tax=Phyllobacterium endophyticum TaxID=1149773 RepID=UPI001AEC7ED3